MSDFKVFSRAVHDRLVSMSNHELYVVGADNREFEQVYLAAFPEGTNPVFRVNREFDCSCCKNFIRNFGNVVALINGKKVSVWDDYADLPHPFNVVGERMSEVVKDCPITSIFRTKELSYGKPTTKEMLESGSVRTWDHFHGTVAARHRSAAPDTAIGEFNAAKDVLLRGLTELKIQALVEVIDLIDSKALYRGEEHSTAVHAFNVAYLAYNQMSYNGREVFLWSNAMQPWARFRNTVIGTLVVDLSNGMDIEAAVKAFEFKVAPANYKRPTALITPAMVNQAMDTIKALDLESALERRHATLADISVNNVLWVDNDAKAHMKSVLESTLLAAAKPKKVKETLATDIDIDTFMDSVLPKAKSMELMVATALSANFVSLTAPVHAGEPRLFKWANDFAWSYDGNITDSIKEKVKKAGGNVTNAKLRVSLAWHNRDDLDIHVFEPNGNRIYFGNKDGKLDVDMNAFGVQSLTPVENVSWVRVVDGVYAVTVHQYTKRDTDNPGFTVEFESAGKLHHLTYPKAVSNTINVAGVIVKNGVIEKISPAHPDLIGGGISMEKWGLNTESWAKVQTVMFSPNYWDDQKIGNKHWFFMLEGCLNPEPTRGIYNEFLRSDLDKHRKVFEVLGNKTKCPVAEQQLSGLGFSSTKGESVAVRINDGQSIRNFNVTF